MSCCNYPGYSRLGWERPRDRGNSLTGPENLKQNCYTRNIFQGIRRRMARSLVIVESPGKVKSIGKYLGRNYSVKASYGHVMDLPRKTIGILLPGEENGKRKKRKKKAKAGKKAAAEKPEKKIPKIVIT